MAGARCLCQITGALQASICMRHMHGFAPSRKGGQAASAAASSGAALLAGLNQTPDATAAAIMLP